MDSVLKLFKKCAVKSAKQAQKSVDKAEARTSEGTMEKLAEIVGGKRRFINNPPLVQRLSDLLSEEQKERITRQDLEEEWFAYLNSLPEERRLLLARAHARTGDSAWISGYLRSGTVFDEAIADFAVACADQAKRDYQALVVAVEAGKIVAQTGI